MMLFVHFEFLKKLPLDELNDKYVYYDGLSFAKNVEDDMFEFGDISKKAETGKQN